MDQASKQQQAEEQAEQQQTASSRRKSKKTNGILVTTRTGERIRSVLNPNASEFIPSASSSSYEGSSHDDRSETGGSYCSYASDEGPLASAATLVEDLAAGGTQMTTIFEMNPEMSAEIVDSIQTNVQVNQVHTSQIFDNIKADARHFYNMSIEECVKADSIRSGDFTEDDRTLQHVECGPLNLSEDLRSDLSSIEASRIPGLTEEQARSSMSAGIHVDTPVSYENARTVGDIQILHGPKVVDSLKYVIGAIEYIENHMAQTEASNQVDSVDGKDEVHETMGKRHKDDCLQNEPINYVGLGAPSIQDHLKCTNAEMQRSMDFAQIQGIKNDQMIYDAHVIHNANTELDPIKHKPVGWENVRIQGERNVMQLPPQVLFEVKSNSEVREVLETQVLHTATSQAFALEVQQKPEVIENVQIERSVDNRQETVISNCVKYDVIVGDMQRPAILQHVKSEKPSAINLNAQIVDQAKSSLVDGIAPKKPMELGRVKSVALVANNRNLSPVYDKVKSYKRIDEINTAKITENVRSELEMTNAEKAEIFERLKSEIDIGPIKRPQLIDSPKNEASNSVCKLQLQESLKAEAIITGRRVCGEVPNVQRLVSKNEFEKEESISKNVLASSVKEDVNMCLPVTSISADSSNSDLSDLFKKIQMYEPWGATETSNSERETERSTSELEYVIKSSELEEEVHNEEQILRSLERLLGTSSSPDFESSSLSLTADSEIDDDAIEKEMNQLIYGKMGITAMELSKVLKNTFTQNSISKSLNRKKSDSDDDKISEALQAVFFQQDVIINEPRATDAMKALTPLTKDIPKPTQSEIEMLAIKNKDTQQITLKNRTCPGALAPPPTPTEEYTEMQRLAKLEALKSLSEAEQSPKKDVGKTGATGSCLTKLTTWASGGKTNKSSGGSSGSIKSTAAKPIVASLKKVKPAVKKENSTGTFKRLSESLHSFSSVFKSSAKKRSSLDGNKENDFQSSLTETLTASVMSAPAKPTTPPRKRFSFKKTRNTAVSKIVPTAPASAPTSSLFAK